MVMRLATVLLSLGLIALATCNPSYGYGPIKVNGGWSEWSSTRCSATCGKGTVTKTRTCTNPAPAHGGDNCKGKSKMTEECDTYVRCPVNGEWSEWSKAECSATCGKGSMKMTRTCTNPAPAYGGDECDGEDEMTEECDTYVKCPVHGGWSEWSKAECSATCGKGSMKMARTCTNPAPAYGGGECDGEDEMVEECDTYVKCPVHGGWSEWSDGECSATCGKGILTRTRKCNNPTPAYGGMDCDGEEYITSQCDTDIKCPVHGGWTEWAEWSDCSKSCQGGVTTRTRSCTNPAPAYGGDGCDGDHMEERSCNDYVPCAVNGGWGEWQQWSDCSKSCGGGRMVRERKCNSPSPAHGGKPCKGRRRQRKPCNKQQCNK